MFAVSCIHCTGVPAESFPDAVITTHLNIFRCWRPNSIAWGIWFRALNSYLRKCSLKGRESKVREEEKGILENKRKKWKRNDYEGSLKDCVEVENVWQPTRKCECGMSTISLKLKTMKTFWIVCLNDTFIL